MPKIFEREGYLFFFYSNEHEPMHVHVRYAGGEAVFNIGRDVVLREAVGLKIKELSKAQKLAEEGKDLIVSAWNEHITR